MEYGTIEAEVLVEEIVRCRRCGQLNRTFAIDQGRGFRCGNCGARLANPFSPYHRFLRWAQSHLVAVSAVLACAILVVLGFQVSKRRGEITRLREQFRTEAARRERQNEQRLEDDYKKYRAMLLDAELVLGHKARRVHAQEWEKRMAHEAQLARTPIEKTMREMELLGKNTTLPAEQILEKVAQMTSPAGSRIKVTPIEGKFAIQVAYRISAVTLGESGAWTKHHSVEALRKEAIEISARVVRDLYDYCGRRGIGAIVVSCNHAVQTISSDIPESQKEAAWDKAPVVWSVFYRCTIPEATAQAVPNWRKLSLHKIADMFVAEDRMGNLTIRKRASLLERPSDAQIWDPQGSLEF